MSEFKIWQVNDCDFVVARTREEAKDVINSIQDWDEDWDADGYPKIMSDKDAETTPFILDVEKDHDDPLNRTTFKTEFNKRLKNGLSSPEMFATTEF